MIVLTIKDIIGLSALVLVFVAALSITLYEVMRGKK